MSFADISSGTRAAARRFGPTNIANFAVALTTAIGFAVFLFYRNSTLFLHPQLWAEDTFIYFNEDRLFGASAILMQWNGFKQIACRLIAYAAGLAPAEWAPPIYVVAFVLSIFATAAIAYTSPVFSGWARAFAAMVVVAAPVSSEVFLGMCYTQWVLGPIVALAMFERPGWKRGSVLAIGYGLVGLSSPFTILATPSLLYKIATERSRYAFLLLAINIGAALFHLENMIGRVTNYEVPGTVIGRFANSATFFYRWLTGPHHPGTTAAVTVSIATTAFLVAYLYQNRVTALRPVAYFMPLAAAVLVMGCSTADPTMLPNQFGAGARYFYIPAVLTLWTLISIEQTHRRAIFTLPTSALVVVGIFSSYADRVHPYFGKDRWADVALCLRDKPQCETATNPLMVGPVHIPSDLELSRMTIHERRSFRSRR